MPTANTRQITTNRKARRNILLAFLAYVGFVVLLACSAYLFEPWGLYGEAIAPDDCSEMGEVEAGTDSGVGCIDDCLDGYDVFEVHDGDSIFFI